MAGMWDCISTTNNYTLLATEILLLNLGSTNSKCHMLFLSVLKHRINVFPLLFFTLFFVASCSKEKLPPNKPDPSGAKELTEVRILKSDNPNFSEDGYSYKSGQKVYITIPLNAGLSPVKVAFTVSDKAIVKINGTIIPNNKGNVDLSQTTTAVVTAEDGTTASYTLLAQAGIKDIDAMIYPFIEKYNMPAASYAIGKNSLEKIVYKNASGFADTVSKIRATPNHMFRLASMTKQHTAIAIMTLIQKGKIKIDDLVFGSTGILKDFFPTVGPMSAKVTVQHLLEHTGGYTGDPMFDAAQAGKTLDERIQVMLNSAQSEPGTKYYYYNMGYGVLGKIIEVVTGKTYETYLKEIYAPAGITNLYLGASSAATVRANEAIAYGQGNSNAYGNDINVYKAAGGVLINTEDLFKVLYAVDGGTITPDILNNEMRTLMFTKSAVSNYCKGWRSNHSLFNGYYHGGNLAGTATFWIFGDEYSVAVLCNSRNYDANFDTDLIVLTNNIMKKAKELGL